MSDAHRYALLPKAGINRVYGAATLSLTRAELGFMGDALRPGLIDTTEVLRLGGVEYLSFETGRPLTEDDLAIVGNISTMHALFELAEHHGSVLRPLGVEPHEVWDDDILTISRYQGKTNEQFTRLLTNVTLAAAGDSFARMLRNEPVQLLDPLCGRGTTLNMAVLYGLEAFGVELARKDFELYRDFIIRWLKDKRIKHRVQQETHRKGRDKPIRRLHVTYWSKDDPAQRHRVIEAVNDDTVHALDSFARRSMDVIVTDLPYGVQHSARQSGSRPRRRPDDLLAEALPVWVELLRDGGALGVSWNRKTLGRDRLVELVDQAGLGVIGARESDAFAHVVDRAITRDLLVATKPS